VDYLLLDESQDSTALQFEFMLDMVQPKNWMLFGDHRQSIFGFADADPNYLFSLMRDPETTVYDLDENYRNAPEILTYAQTIIRQLGYDFEDYSESMRNTHGRVVETEYSGDGIARTIARYVEEGRALYSDWFVLTRTNAESEAIMRVLEKHNIPHDSFKKA
jgi:DNA helicase-2/ATP-dependent DNA helicase PcrA